MREKGSGRQRAHVFVAVVLVLGMALGGCAGGTPAAQQTTFADEPVDAAYAETPWEPDFMASEQEPAPEAEQAALDAAVADAGELAFAGIPGSVALEEPANAYFSVDPETHKVSISYVATGPLLEDAIATGNALARLLDYCARYRLAAAGEGGAALSLEPAEVGLALLDAAAGDAEALGGHYGLEYIELGVLYDSYDLSLYCDDGAGGVVVEGYKPAGAGIPITWQ